jgi:hypothetical protein
MIYFQSQDEQSRTETTAAPTTSESQAVKQPSAATKAVEPFIVSRQENREDPKAVIIHFPDEAIEVKVVKFELRCFPLGRDDGREEPTKEQKKQWCNSLWVTTEIYNRTASRLRYLVECTAFDRNHAPLSTGYSDKNPDVYGPEGQRVLYEGLSL